MSTAKSRTEWRRASWTRPGIEGFHLLLAASLVSCVVEDLVNGVWFIHTGRFFPWRHWAFIPLFPAPLLILQWTLLLGAALCLVFGVRRRAGAWIGCLTLLVSLLQTYSNQQALLAIVIGILAIAPRARPESAFKMIRYQLWIVYLFSALNKIESGFIDGKSLAALGRHNHGAWVPDAWVRALLSGSFAAPLSWAIVAAELAMPVLLMRAPRAGFIAAIVLHLGFSLMMPGLWPFSFTMVALAATFSIRDGDRTEEDRFGGNVSEG